MLPGLAKRARPRGCGAPAGVDSNSPVTVPFSATGAPAAGVDSCPGLRGRRHTCKKEVNQLEEGGQRGGNGEKKRAGGRVRRA